MKLFREGRDAIQDSRLSGRPHVDNHTIQLLASLLHVVHRWAAWELAAEVGVCHKTVLHILHDILGYRKIAARWVPHTMSEVQQWQRYATHILCDCEAVAEIRFRHLGQFFMEPSDYYDAPIDKVLHFCRGVGLIKG
jgi:hypothetical protein